MSLKKCPKCAEKVKWDAKVCKHCSYEFTEEELASARKDRKNGIIGASIVVVLACVGLAMCTAEDDNEGSVSSSPPASVVSGDTQAQDVKPAGLGITPSELSNRFNKHMAELKMPWRINDVKIEDGVISYAFTDNMVLSGAVSDDGELVNLLIIGGGDGTAMSGLNIFGVMTAAFAACLKHDDMKTVGPIMMDMVNDFKEKGKSKKIHNNIQASYSQNEVLGNIFSIEAVK